MTANEKAERRDAAAARLSALESDAAAVERRAGAVAAELDALRQLAATTDEEPNAAIRAIRVALSYAAALAAVLADDLMASLDSDPLRRWMGGPSSAVDPAPSLPCQRPSARRRRAGPWRPGRRDRCRLARGRRRDRGALRGNLAPGQTLVSRTGTFWR